MRQTGGSYQEHRQSVLDRQRRHSIGFFVLILAIIFGSTQVFAYWSNPDESAPSSTWAPPLIVGNPDDPNDPINSLMQTKAGPLTVDGLMSVKGPTTVTEITASNTVRVNGQLCLRGDCVTDWDAITGYVHLYDGASGGFSPAPDIGNFGLESSSPALDSSSRIIPPEDSFITFSVEGDAQEPDPITETAGIIGQSYRIEGVPNNSFGIGGNAANISYCVGGTNPGQACSDSTPCPGSGAVCQGVENSAGVMGSNGGNANAWAGKFDARVGIEGELCINSDDSCRDKSNIIGTNPYDEYVRVQQDPDPVFQNGLVQVEGSFQGGVIVLGMPTDTTSVLITCGDGVCNYGVNGENSINCSADCP